MDDNHTPKRKKFRLFDSQREGKGVEKHDIETKPNLKRFFRLYKDNLNKLLSLNILMVLGNIPLLFAVLAASNVLTRTVFTPESGIYPVLRAVLLTHDVLSPADLALIGVEGIQVTEVVRTAGNYVLFGLSALTLFTFGVVNVGAAYITRNIVMGDPVFVFSDFFYAIRRNWKQALPFGILDLILLVVIPTNVVILFSGSGFLSALFMWANIIFGILYVFMRFYIYVQMVTFDLKLRKILKNALLFSLLGLKRNILALLGIVLLSIFCLLFVFGFGGMLLPLGIAFPLIFLFSHTVFMSTYASYYKIKEIMIDPYREEAQSEA